MSFSRPISGSYDPNECQFLLQIIDVPRLSVEEKERQLQAGIKHYSEMVSLESIPSDQYLTVFHELVNRYKHRLAREITDLASQIHAMKGSMVTLVSLARAGTPVGVLLCRALRYYYGVDVKHFSISIVRDKGIDEEALRFIEQTGRPSESILFVDGWTAKGVITRELKKAITLWNSTSTYQIPDELCVISDIGGCADLVASTEDYCIPSGILNSTVSGLVSRSILLKDYPGFHQCVLYPELEQHDLSRWFVDQISDLFDKRIMSSSGVLQNEQKLNNHAMLQAYIQDLMQKYGVADINRIKPGIAEATRVMLRRVPRMLLVRDQSSIDVSHLLVLAQEKEIAILEDTTMPFNAVAIISEVVV